MRQLWAPWRMAYVGGEASKPGGCFICDALESDARSSLVVERTDASITLLNRYPYSSGHVMVAPVRHAPDITSLDSHDGSELFAGIQRAVRAIRTAMHPEGFNIGINHGLVAGASIEHVHVHVVPRWSGDTNFMPVIGDVKVLPEHLEATAAKLRDAYSTLEAK